MSMTPGATPSAAPEPWQAPSGNGTPSATAVTISDMPVRKLESWIDTTGSVLMRLFSLKKSINVVLVFSILLIYLLNAVGCAPGLADWSYALPNDYELEHINAEEIVLSRRHSKVIGAFIEEFWYSERWIGIKQIKKLRKDNVNTNSDTYQTQQYYLVDAENCLVYGPFSYTEYMDSCELLDVQTSIEWIKTVPKPEGAYPPEVF